jgi:PTS system trehalose-specific IIC component
MSDLEQPSREIIEAVGGAGNIVALTNCVTRLRFALADDSLIDTAKLSANDLVQGSFMANGQFQVIIGPGTVERVAAEIQRQTGGATASKAEVAAAGAQKMHPVQQAIKVLADIFIPLLPAIVSAGLLMGINNLLTGPGIFFDDTSVIDEFPQLADFTAVVNLIANTAFVFLPMLVGWSAVKRFGGNPLLGIVLGGILVHPDLLNAWGYAAAKEAGTIPTWDLFGLEVQAVGYQGQVLPILVASWVLAKLEIWLKKKIPDMFQLLLVAPIALLITGFASFLFIGPVTFWMGNVLTNALVNIFDVAPWLGGLLYGAFYAPLVITGMHHTFLAVDLQLIGTTGATFLWPILALSNIAQGSAALGMMLVAANQKEKGLALASGVSAYLGITEPAIFGVNLRFKFPFFIAMTFSGLAGMFIAIQGVQATSIGVGGIPGVFSIVPGQWGMFGVGMLIVLAGPLLGTWLYAKARHQEETPEQAAELDAAVA